MKYTKNSSDVCVCTYLFRLVYNIYYKLFGYLWYNVIHILSKNTETDESKLRN